MWTPFYNITFEIFPLKTISAANSKNYEPQGDCMEYQKKAIFVGQ